MFKAEGEVRYLGVCHISVKTGVLFPRTHMECGAVVPYNHRFRGLSKMAPIGS